VIRPARPDDVDRIVALVRELADYERAGHEVRLTPAALRGSLFAEQPAVFCHLATAGPEGEVVGFALWFLNFSTWLGRHGIYLEDLYVRPQHRGQGHGRALLRTLAGLCVERGYGRLEWWVLDWNTPAIGFYAALGAVGMDQWTVWRLDGTALRRLAAG
jgi:GNAT superfamily N-acetyltransferase